MFVTVDTKLYAYLEKETKAFSLVKKNIECEQNLDRWGMFNVNNKKKKIKELKKENRKKWADVLKV